MDRGSMLALALMCVIVAGVGGQSPAEAPNPSPATPAATPPEKAPTRPAPLSSPPAKAPAAFPPKPTTPAPATSSVRVSSPPAKSPPSPDPESPSLANLYSDLSPLKSVPSHGSQSFPLYSLAPVFMSPRDQNRLDSKTMDPQYCVNNWSSIQGEHSLSPYTEDVVHKSSQCLAQNVEICRNESEQSSRMTAGVPVKADRRHSNVFRHLQFGPTIPDETPNSSNSSLPEALLPISNVIRSQNEVCKAPSSSGASAASLLNSLMAESFEPRSNYLYGRSTGIHSRFGLPFSSITRSLSMDSNIIPFISVGNQNSQELGSLSYPFSSITRSLSMDSNIIPFRSVGNQNSQELGSLSYPFSSITRSQSRDSNITPFRSVGNQNVQELGSPSYPFTRVQPLPDSRFQMPAIPENRKRTKDLIDPEGGRSCNCKKSRCLKLYCDCFANGEYCQDTCSCENCLNKKDYEDTVLDTRQQIETRNPLAFVPKVVNPTAGTPTYIPENANLTTPASARHKRGCTCRKSKCLKKYCECYQSGVGCYSGCRCENCENPSGRKPESVHRRIENWDLPYVLESSSSQISERKVLSDMNSDKKFSNLSEDYPIPGIIRKTSNPIKPVKATSPNKKAVSPPPDQSNDSSPITSEAARDFR